VLPPENRLRRSADFRRALREGRGKSSRTLAVRAAVAERGEPTVRVGFVVSKAVGGAVVRNRVRRRLREAVRPRLAALDSSDGLDIVVRALPAAADADAAELAGDLASCLDAVWPVSA
jgi:ribonuclease P protein component